MQKIFFELSSYRLASGKWISSYRKITRSGSETKMQDISWDKQFDTKEKADKYATNYCLEQGYIPEK